MRVLNDRQEKSEPSELGFFTIAAYAILSAFGIASVILGPLPMILAHIRLTDPWPKVTALIGAVIAITFLEVPLPLVAVSFIVGLFIADGVWKETNFWALVRNTLLLACVVGALLLVVLAQSEKLTPGVFWSHQVDAFITQLQASIQPDRDFKWDVMRGLILYEGPFFYLSGVILSLWLSIGVTAHLGWVEGAHRFSGESLRQIRVPAWSSVVFVMLFAGAFSGSVQLQRVFGGLFRVAGCLMFIQGTVCLSEILARREIRPRVRTLIYSLAILIGFYALVGIGAMSPFIFKKSFWTKKLEEVT